MQSLDARRLPLLHMPWCRRVSEIIAPVSCSTSRDDLETWLLASIAEALEADPLAIDPMLPPSVYGFDAAAARALTRELEQCLHRDLPVDIFSSGRSIRAIARSLCADSRLRNTTLPLTREAMRQLVLARAARLPRRPLASRALDRNRGPAGCSPSHATAANPFDLALAS